MFKTERQVIAFLEGCLRYKPDTYVQKTYLRFTAGFPDLIIRCHGVTCFFEIKPFKQDLAHSLKLIEPIQWATLGKMQAAGMTAKVIILETKDRGWTVSRPGLMTEHHDFKARWTEDPTYFARWP